MPYLVFVLDSTAILGCVAIVLLLCRVAARVNRLSKLVAEIEVQETMDRILIEMPAIEPPALEQRARMDIRPAAARILREQVGEEYEAWLAKTATEKAGKDR